MIKLKREAMSDTFREFTKSVFEFNWLAGNTTRKGVVEPHRWRELMSLYHSLIKEELEELDEAFLADDTEEVLDAVGDTLVVATFYHYLTQYGDGDVVDYKSYLNSEDAGENLYQYTAERNMEDWSVEFKRAALIGNLQRLWSLVYELDVFTDFLLDITKSNMSKFAKMGDEKATIWAGILEAQHGQVVRFEQVGDYTRFIRADGKLLKGNGFVRPELEGYYWGM